MPPRYKRLSFFYFIYFSVFGIYLPYWTLYLSDLGMTPAEVGELLAIVIGTKFFASYIWGWISDHTASRMMLIKTAGLLSFIFFSMILVKQSFAFLAIFLFLFSFFWNALLPQMEVITFNSLRYQARRYSSIRLWGSVGFIVCAIGFAPIIDHWGSHIVPWLLVGILLVLWISTLKIPDLYRSSTTTGGSILPYLCRPEIICLLAICLMMQLSHGTYYAFFSIYMREHGYTDAIIGYLWALGVIAEIGMFIWMPRLLQHWNAPTLLIISLIITTMRWILIALFSEHITVLLIAQSLHAISFGTYHAAAIYLISRWFSGHSQGRGQALYTGISFGLGGAIGSLMAGYLWEARGGSFSFLLSAVIVASVLPLTIPLFKAKTS